MDQNTKLVRIHTLSSAILISLRNGNTNPHLVYIFTESIFYLTKWPDHMIKENIANFDMDDKQAKEIIKGG